MLAILLALPATVPAAQRGKKKEKTDVFGYYFPTGKVPKELTEIDHLHLSTIDERGKEAPLNGVLQLKGKGKAKGAELKLTKVKLTGTTLTFTTVVVKKVSYKFLGTFTKLGDFPNKPPTKGVILEGQLTRMEGKKKTFDGKVSFRYEPGG